MFGDVHNQVAIQFAGCVGGGETVGNRAVSTLTEDYMRKYTADFVKRHFTGYRITTAACPFPGKYPLRLLMMLNGEVLYHGKFHAGIWRYLSRKFRAEPNILNSVFIIYDKGGAVSYGNGVNYTNGVRRELTYRYFGRPGSPTGFELTKFVPIDVGTYRFYSYPDMTQEQKALYRRYVNTNVPHVTTV